MCSRHASDEIIFAQLVNGSALGTSSYGDGKDLIVLNFIVSYYDFDNDQWLPYSITNIGLDSGYNTISIQNETYNRWTDGQTGKFQLVANVTHHDPDGDGGWDDITYSWEEVQ